MSTSDQITRVERRLETEPRDGGEARVVVATQTYDTGIDDVWDAITNGERIPRWLMPISGELRLGGRYQLEGNAGGEVVTCEKPTRLGVTWEYGGQVSWVDVDLTAESAGRTTLRMRHAARIDDDAMWKQFGPAAVGIGWDSMLLGLAQHLGSGGGIRPEEALAWQLSPEGVAFMTASGRAWAAAAVAAGDDEAEAVGAADRTIAMYTTPPEGATEG